MYTDSNSAGATIALLLVTVGIGLQSNDEKVNKLLAKVEEFSPAILFSALVHQDMVTDCQIPNFIRGPFLGKHRLFFVFF